MLSGLIASEPGFHNFFSLGAALIDPISCRSRLYAAGDSIYKWMPGQKIDEDMKVSRQWTSAPGFSILLPVSTGVTTPGRRSLFCRLDEFLNCAARRAACSRSVNRDIDAQSVFAREGHVVAWWRKTFQKMAPCTPDLKGNQSELVFANDLRLTGYVRRRCLSRASLASTCPNCPLELTQRWKSISIGSETGESRAEDLRVIDEDDLSDPGIGCNGKTRPS